MNIPFLLQLLNRPWLIESQQAEYWAGMAHKILFENAAFPGNPNAHKPNAWGEKSYAYRVDANGMRNMEGNVLVVEMKGPLMKADYCGSPGMETLAQVIEAAQMDDTVHSIVGRIDSPGGTVDGTHNLARTIKRSPKATVAYAHGYMCSAAYWIGSSFKEVIADDANRGQITTIGSIGTMLSFIDDKAAMEKQGYKVRHIYATKSKRKGRMYNDLMEGKDDKLIAELDALNDTFIADVQANRRGKLNTKAEDVFEGDVYKAQEALKYGLIDKMATFRYAVKRSLQIAKTIS